MSSGRRAGGGPISAVLIVLTCASTSSSDEPQSAGRRPTCPEGWFEQATHDAIPPSESPTFPCGLWGRSPYIYEESIDGKILPVFIEGPRGPQVRARMSYQELKELAASTEPIPPELQMSREAFVQLVEQLDLVRASTAKYQDLNVAIRDGYELGSFNHYIHPGRLSDGVFKLTEPENLLYKVDDDTGEAELFGVAFLLPLREVGTGHPEGFVGPLDN